MIEAAHAGNVRTVEILLSAIRDNKPSVLSPLLLHASFWNHQQVATLLITHGADVNWKSKDEGDTPLHKAVGMNAKEVVILLLKHGADRNAKNAQGKTPVDLARDSDSQDLLRLLQR